MKRKSQKDKILAYMLSGKRITPALAYEKFGCLRLSERIREIQFDRDLDMQVFVKDIKKDWKKTKYSQVMEYWL